MTRIPVATIDCTPHLTAQLAAARAAVGRSYRRPTGLVVYTVRSAELVAVKPWLTIVQCTCDTTDGPRAVAWTAVRRMVRA